MHRTLCRPGPQRPGLRQVSDESTVEICGIESIVFMAKIGEHKLLHGVNYIPALRNSIINLGQLDEGGSRVEIDRGGAPNLGPPQSSSRQGQPRTQPVVHASHGGGPTPLPRHPEARA
jgi:hypothetical protein